jgi:fermentation-respiration switch protein FrsA (DUF1100 family)
MRFRSITHWLWLVIFASVGCAHLDYISPLSPLEKSFVYQPVPFPSDLPADLPFEDVWFQSSDDTRLHGWLLEHPTPRAVVLFCHGNAGNMASRASTLWLLHRRHALTVMSFDYRGYGHSEGRPSESGILRDARSARAWLASRTRVAESDIVMMGRSLGGAVAVDLAARDGARGLVLASTFTSLPDVGAYHMPWALPHWFMTQRLDSRRKLKDYRGPLLQSHGDADRVIPISLGRELHEVAPGPKQFVVIQGADHNDPQSEEYRIAFDQFLDRLPATR